MFPRTKKKNSLGCSFFLLRCFFGVYESMLLLMLLYVHGIPWSKKKGGRARESEQWVKANEVRDVPRSLLTREIAIEPMLPQPKEEINKNCIASIWALGPSSTALTGGQQELISFFSLCMFDLDWPSWPLFGATLGFEAIPLKRWFCICQWPDDKREGEGGDDWFLCRTKG